MANLGLILFILCLLIPLWRKLNRNLAGGVALAVFLCVSMSTLVRISLPGSLPELTIHRLILLSVFCFWIKSRDPISPPRPLLGCFLFWILANAVSVVGTEAAMITSVKRTLDFVLETFLFYIIITSVIREEAHAVAIIRAAVLGLTLVAALGVIEHYTRFNPVDRFLPGYVRDDLGQRDVMVTFQHRILLGTAMAMGVPLGFFLLLRPGAPKSAVPILWVAICLMSATCFFSMSRGPWIGFGIALAMLALGGSRRLRTGMLWVVVMGALTLVIKPGVKDSLIGAYEMTVDPESLKGGNLQYRIELWKVAYAKVSGSPWRYLFGYGPGAGAEMEIDWELSYRENRHRERQIESWDNHFAYSLLQSGIVGFTANSLLILRVLYLMFQGWRRVQAQAKDAMLCLMASAFVLFFMMTNVLIFAKQLDYLFWSIVGSGAVIASCYSKTAASRQEGVGRETVSCVEAEPRFACSVSHVFGDWKELKRRKDVCDKII